MQIQLQKKTANLNKEKEVIILAVDSTKINVSKRGNRYITNKIKIMFNINTCIVKIRTK